MSKVFLGLGSNIKPQDHIRQALLALHEQFGSLELSPVYESEAVGFKGDNFLNLVVSIHTELTVGQLQSRLKTIEDESGRNRNSPKYSGRTLDIDILIYDDKYGTYDGVALPRGEILRNAFVLKPLCDLAPEIIHPGKQKTMMQLWHEYDQDKQKLWPVTLNQ